MGKYNGLEVYDTNEEDKPKENIMTKFLKKTGIKDNMDKKKSDEIFRNELRAEAEKEAREEIKTQLKEQYKKQIIDEELKKGMKKEGFAQKIAAEFKGGLDKLETDKKMDRLLGKQDSTNTALDKMLSKGGNFKEVVGVRGVNTDIIKGRPQNIGNEDKLKNAMGKERASNEKLKSMLKRK